MAFPICMAKNITDATFIIMGTTLAAGQEMRIPDEDRIAWANDDVVLSSIFLRNVQIGNGAEYFESINDQITWLKGY